MRLVRDVMLPAPPKLAAGTSVAAAAEVMRQHEVDLLPVLAGERLVGVVDSLSLSLYAPEAAVGEAASDVPAFSPEMPLAEAATRMRSERRWLAPVVADGDVVGILPARSLLPVSPHVPAEGPALVHAPALNGHARSNGAGRSHPNPVVSTVPEGSRGENRAGLSGVILDDCRITSLGEGVEVTVRLKRGSQSIERRGVAQGDELVRTLAAATAKCAEPFVSEPLDLQVEETYEYTSPLGVPCVGATVCAVRENGTERLVGVVPMTGSYHEAYINAVLDAANRLSQAA